MSIASEITRLQGAKTCLKASIEAKGVSVPSDLTLEDYYACIDEIQTGGGCPKVDVLVVGGGQRGLGSVSGSSSKGKYKRCGGDYCGYSGGAILCEGYEFSPFSNPISVTVGTREHLANTGSTCATNSKFLDLVAYSGSNVPYSHGQQCARGENVGSNPWAYGGFGGAGSPGCPGSISGDTLYGGAGGDGLQTDIDGTMRRYAGGAGGGGMYNCQSSNFNIVLGPHGCGYNRCGGSGHPDSCDGYNGIVVVRYKTDGSCGISNATGGCKYTCGEYTIHCFTSSGTFCITG